VANETIDDVSSAAEQTPATPVIVMVATGTTASSLVLPAVGQVGLGRRIACGNRVEEVDDERMSRDHATVRWERGGWRITDQNSRNGTFVDGQRLDGETVLPTDVVLRLGHTVFILVRDGRGYGPADFDPDQVVGPELARIYEQIRRNVETDTLLIHGESGSGKELAARLYHDSGPRNAGPFVPVNCAAIPEGVAERLLFGSKKGAFSGATDAVGYLQSAHGGTLFLDEIADLDPAVQAKLLRVLETREVVPVGATSPVVVELGVVAASHRELRAAVADKRFRDDLYYRLARTVVHLPPLRARKVDIARLVVRELASVDKKLVAHAKLIEACCVRPWPGNIRELRAAVRNAANEAIATKRDMVRAEDLQAHVGFFVVSAEADTQNARPRAQPDVLDKETVQAALEQANGVISVAARTLGLHRTQLYRLMTKLGIMRDDT